MFNFEQLDLDTSFTTIDPHSSTAKARQLLKHFRFVIVETVSSYVISAGELYTLEICDPDLSVGEWMRKTGRRASSVCRRAGLAGSDVDWSGPVIILGENSEKLGVATPEAVIRCLAAEKKQLTSFLSALVETVNDAVTALDREGRVIYWNHTAEEVYGIPKADIVGRKIGEHFDKDAVMLHRILDEGRTVRQVYHQPAPNTHVLISASPIVDDNRIIGGVATEQDITRIVRLNEELYASAPSRTETDEPFSSIIGMGAAFMRSLDVARKFADAATPVLLVGEPGSGKEMLAQAIHSGGKRKNALFLSLRCGAIPPGLLDTELFGYQGGAFTSGDDNGRAGKLELADGGTLFLEEIGEMPLAIQLKVSQYLKTKSINRIGGEAVIAADTRIIATAPSSLQPLMEQGLFLEELFYQLNVMSIDIPPLRNRTEDIPELAQSFIREFTERYRKPVPKLDAGAMTALMNYRWPGNIRELRNVMERLIILCDGDTITVNQLPPVLLPHAQVEVRNAENANKGTVTGPANEEVRIQEALRTAYGNKSAAAKILGISRGTLYKKMREYGIRFPG